MDKLDLDVEVSEILHFVRSGKIVSTASKEVAQKFKEQAEAHGLLLYERTVRDDWEKHYEFVLASSPHSRGFNDPVQPVPEGYKLRVLKSNPSR